MAGLDPPDEIDEVDLILRLIEKDKAALAELLKYYGPKIRGFLRRKFDCELNHAEIDVVFNQAAYNLWRFADRIDPDRKSLKSWFIKIAVNAAFSYLRGSKRHLAVELEYDPSYDPAADCEDQVPDVDSREHKRQVQLKDFIFNKLIGFERTVAINCFLTGGDPDLTRLAQKYGKSRQNVDTVKSKVKKKITDWMLAWDGRVKP